MRPFRAALLAVVVALTASCGSGSEVALRVGEVTFTHEDVLHEIDQVIEHREFYATAFGFCPTTGEQLAQGFVDPATIDDTCPDAAGAELDGTLPRSTVEFVLVRRIFVERLEQEYAARGFTPGPEVIAEVDAAFAQPGPDGRTFEELIRIGDEGRDSAYLEQVRSDVIAQLATSFAFTSQDDFNAFLATSAVDVELHDRYGTWDPALSDFAPTLAPQSDPGAGT